MKPEKPESSDEATGNESFVRKAAFESEAPANADETQTGLPKGDASKGPLPTGTKRVVPAAPLAEGIAPAGRGEGASAFIPPKELVPPKPRPAIKRGAPDLHIPGYQIEGVIGRGSTGTVYRARQETVDRVVALKVLHAELTKRPRMVRRLQREARTTARLAHPHIVSAIDMGRTGDRWWFAMELVDGPSLALKLRQEGRLDEREALRFFIPLCESLVHIWENGVVHRDIKPGNILIDRVSGARLADLGLAFADDDPSLTGSEGTLGTPHYISPEQTRDPSAVDIRTDIWSFGATLFHAVCGAPPFSGANVAEVLSGVLYGRVPDPLELEPDLTRGLALVIRKCLSRDFERRYQTPRDLLTDLERVRERRKPKVRAASLEPTAGAGIGTYKTIAIGTLASLFLGGAMLLWIRPWEEKTGPTLFEPLTELARQLDSDVPEAERLVPIVLISRLEAMKDLVPSTDLARWRAVISGARQIEAKVLSEIFAECETSFRAALEERDFVAAGTALGSALDVTLIERVGLPLKDASYEFKVGLAPLRRDLEQSLAATESTLRAQLTLGLSKDYLATADQLVKEGRWRDAVAHLSAPPEEVVTRIGLSFAGLPTVSEERLSSSIARRLSDERTELQRRWSGLDDELVRWIELSSREYFRQLKESLEPMNSGALLRDGFSTELQRRGLIRDQMLIQPRGLALEVLGSSASDLEVYEASLALGLNSSDQDALDALGTWLDELASGNAWQERRYDDAASYWRGRHEWLLSNAKASRAAWWRELDGRVSARIEEAALLSDLVNLAADKIGERNGKRLELYIGEGVLVAGRVERIAETPSGGFQFEVDGQHTYLMFLAAPRGGLPQEGTLVSARDVLKLAGLNLDEDRARLATAFFHAREGQPSTALELLNRAPLGLEYNGLAEELMRSLDRARTVLEVRAELRAKEAQARLNTLFFGLPNQLDRLKRDPELAVETIERLLNEYSDVPQVIDAEESLTELRRVLRSPGGRPTLEDFVAAYGQDVVSFHLEGYVELFYDFVLDASLPGITHEDWTPDGAGWSSPTDIASDQDFITRRVPRLVIRDPIGVDSGVLVVEFEIEEPDVAGPERLLIASAVGFHILLQAPKGAIPGRIMASTRPVKEMLADLRSGEGKQLGTKLLEASSLHSHWKSGAEKRTGCLLRLELDKRRGRVLVLYDGVELLQAVLTSPGTGPGTYGIELRAREQIRLRSLRVRAKR
jgi:hypothetical protein